MSGKHENWRIIVTDSGNAWLKQGKKKTKIHTLQAMAHLLHVFEPQMQAYAEEVAKTKREVDAVTEVQDGDAVVPTVHAVEAAEAGGNF